MAVYSCFCPHPQLLVLKNCSRNVRPLHSIGVDQRSRVSLGGKSTDIFGLQVAKSRVKPWSDLNFTGGFEVTNRRGSRVKVLCFAVSQIATSVFTMGTTAVLPFYSLMVLAPHSRLTRKVMESSIPYVVFGLLYAYVVYLSWTPDTIRYMFASKYLLPELSGIMKMFSSELTLASAWLHLLAVDLFAARQVYHDGLENEVETRHSVSLCLLFCPIGIMTHAFTKALTKHTRKAKTSL